MILGFCGTQPTGWGISTDDWLFCGYPSDGARGTVTKFEEIPNCGGEEETKIIDAAGNELASYVLAHDYTWVLAIPIATIGVTPTTVTELAYFLDGDEFSADVTEPDALDLSGNDGTADAKITVNGNGKRWTVPGAGVTTGDYNLFNDLKFSGTVTVGANCVLTRCGQ